MDNLQKFKGVISDVLKINEEDISDSLMPEDIAEWNSLNHLILISELEDTFNISFDIDDIPKMKSIGDIKKVLNKYGFNM